jgi:hypothetical protein
LDEGNSEKFHRTAVAALLSAEEFLRESRAACEAFHAASPVSRQSICIHISIFFDKEYILISRRYQFHPTSATTQCPNGNIYIYLYDDFIEKNLYKMKFHFLSKRDITVSALINVAGYGCLFTGAR